MRHFTEIKGIIWKLSTHFRKVYRPAPFLLLALFVACASAPEDRVASALQALIEARQAEAEVYADDQFQEAIEAFEAAQAEIEAENQKWFFSRDYSQAESLLERAGGAAREAAQTAPTRKQQVKSEADNALLEARTAVETAQQELETAPRGKGTRADLEALNNDLLEVESTLTEAQESLKEEAYPEALNQLQRVKEDALEIVEKIEVAR
jgi:hypothetical protein